ncbi:MAG: NADH-quinone oxidoreductase subunit NuoE [Holophagales bacterium]|jgi:NADH:ubiquinone oxidoreductase subunit E|nr:NADH-quinone oxidoreductase subunit NuoE [Holophagales bacterium]
MSHAAACTDNWEEIRNECAKHMPQHIIDFIEESKGHEHPEGNLISILHKVQAHFGFLSKEQLEAVSQLAQIPLAKVAGIATFYHYFRLTPRGKHIINVCMGTACYVKGSEKISQKLKEALGIDFGETTKDCLFTLEAARCLGCCGLAPVIMIDEQVYGPIGPNDIGPILDKYKKEAKSVEAERG